jgi:hypothetical protein
MALRFAQGIMAISKTSSKIEAASHTLGDFKNDRETSDKES